MQVTLMTENYDYYRRKKTEDDDYLRDMIERGTDDSDLLTILEYRGQLYYDSLKRIRRLKEKIGKRGYGYSGSSI